jgi:hypothetical protein
MKMAMKIDQIEYARLTGPNLKTGIIETLKHIYKKQGN